MNQSNKLEDYISSNDIKEIIESGNLVEELLDKEYEYFLYHSMEYSPSTYNRNYKYSLDKKTK